jgi:RNA polymerase sigma-70 factor (ECF subfamily)
VSLNLEIETLYLRYAPMVLRRCRTLLRDDSLSRDAMQDVFVRLMQNQDRLVDQALAGLLFRMATNVSLNLLRTQKRHPEDRDEELLQSIAHTEEPEKRSLARLTLDTLLGREPVSTRDMAVMHFVDGMTYQELAREFGMSVSGVRKRLRLEQERVAGIKEVAP